LETLFTYDLCNQVVTTTDAMGRLTTNSYDPGTCYLTGITDSLGNTTTFINNPHGQPATIIDALGQITSNSYGANGNLIATTDHGGNTSPALSPSTNTICSTGRPGSSLPAAARRLWSTTRWATC
jgi:YD repeat-containing protein